MGKIGYMIAKIKYLVKGRNNEVINNYFRKCGITVGHHTHIFSDISGGEGFLIAIGDNVTISNNVSLITHDASVSHYIDNVTDIFGEIKIGNNCVIGAGSVVVESIKEEGSVWAGNPAKKICMVDSLKVKYNNYTVNLRTCNNKEEMIKSAKKIKR